MSILKQEAPQTRIADLTPQEAVLRAEAVAESADKRWSIAFAQGDRRALRNAYEQSDDARRLAGRIRYNAKRKGQYQG